jgi:hypothetical protein
MAGMPFGFAQVKKPALPPCRGAMWDRGEIAACRYARLAFTSATRMMRRLPSALAARVIVSRVTETF